MGRAAQVLGREPKKALLRALQHGLKVIRCGEKRSYRGTRRWEAALGQENTEGSGRRCDVVWV